MEHRQFGVYLLQSDGEAVTGSGIKVGIIDTGVDYTHPDLGGCNTTQFLQGTCQKVVGGWDFVNNDADPIDDQGHGTLVAAIAASQNNLLRGVAPGAMIYAIKVFQQLWHRLNS